MTANILNYDSIALERDPNLSGNLPLTIPASHDHPETTPKIVDLMKSRAAVAAMVGAVVAAPSKPVAVAVEPLLAAVIGDDAFTDYHKQVVGRMAKAVLLDLGATHTRTGVPVTVTSRFTKGSTYTFPDYQRRPMGR